MQDAQKGAAQRDQETIGTRACRTRPSRHCSDGRKAMRARIRHETGRDRCKAKSCAVGVRLGSNEEHQTERESCAVGALCEAWELSLVGSAFVSTSKILRQSWRFTRLALPPS